jgi:hypothetical protein
MLMDKSLRDNSQKDIEGLFAEDRDGWFALRVALLRFRRYLAERAAALQNVEAWQS